MRAQIATRQELIADLTQALAPGSDEGLLMLVRLHGLQNMTERRGETAHDQFLAEAYELLQQQVGPRGRAYKTRGDELCALLETPLEQAIEVLDKTTSALNKLGATDQVRADASVALLPEEASDPTGALARADRRLLPADDQTGHEQRLTSRHRRRGDNQTYARLSHRTV
jgi:GGDEF domain-containing protein